MISALGIQASIAIDNAINYAELLEKERISQELELASSIQKQILPKGFEKIKGMDIATHFSPAKEIGGDYYDLSLKNNNLSVTIADVPSAEVYDAEGFFVTPGLIDMHVHEPDSHDTTCPATP